MTRPKYPPYRETGVAIPPSHCVSCGNADYRYYTPSSFLKNGLSQSQKIGLTRGVSQKKAASEAHRAIGGVARNSIANRDIVGHYPVLPFLGFLEFLVFFLCEEFLVFLSVFPFFSRDFRGSVGTKNPCFFGGFPALFPKNKERKDKVSRVLWVEECHENILSRFLSLKT